MQPFKRSRHKQTTIVSRPTFARATSIEVSHVAEQSAQYLVYDPITGKNQVDSSEPSIEDNKFYRKVRNTHEKKKEGIIRYERFIDIQYPITNQQVKDLDPDGGEIMLKRLIHLYPKNYRFSFFPANSSQNYGKKIDGVVSGEKYKISSRKIQFFLGQVNLFPPEHYKSFFITQDFDEQGRYELVVNHEGRFHTEVVDDYIPVYKKTEEPVWTRDLQNPWLCILIKMWAKLKGGYHYLETAQPVEFLRTFSNSNWRYYNLAKQPNFLRKFLDSTEVKAVLKSKNDNQVIRQGLAPNQVSYQILDVARKQNKKPKTQSNVKEELIVLVRSTVPLRWEGDLCYGDKRLIKPGQIFVDRRNELINLERTMVMKESDFYNLFTSAYVTSLRAHAVSNYYLIEVPPNTKNAIHLSFTLEKAGFIDFSFQQPLQNKRTPNATSRLQINEQRRNQIRNSKYLDEDQVERFQKCKYMLIRNIREERQQNQVRQYERARREQMTNFERQRLQFQEEYGGLDYYCVQPEYLKGYNQGEGHFVSVDKGEYLIRFRPETSTQKTYYILNYTSNQNIKMREINVSAQQRGQILNQALISLGGRVNYITLNKKSELDRISFGNQFQNIGYSFIAVTSKKINNKIIKIEIDPEEVRNSGYRIKNPYKDQKLPFAILVLKGQNSGLTLKKIPHAQKYVWPPQGINIMYK